MTFSTRGRNSLDFLAPQGKTKVEKMTFSTQGRNSLDLLSEYVRICSEYVRICPTRLTRYCESAGRPAESAGHADQVDPLISEKGVSACQIVCRSTRLIEIPWICWPRRARLRSNKICFQPKVEIPWIVWPRRARLRSKK